MPEMTIGMKKTPRSEVLNLILALSPIARASATALTTIDGHDGEAEGEPVGLQDARVAEERRVVRQPDEVPVPVALVVREAVEQADERRQRDEQGEQEDHREQHDQVGTPSTRLRGYVTSAC